jgi:hypothetical protein
MAKAEIEAAAGAAIIALLPGRFDTRWFQALRPTRICWYNRRVVFVDHSNPAQKDSAKFPSVFAYWGEDTGHFHATFGPHGAVTTWDGPLVCQG